MASVIVLSKYRFMYILYLYRH